MKLLCLLLMGCASSYWVRDQDFRIESRPESVPAKRESGQPVFLKAASLDGIRPTETRGSVLKVKPRHRRNKAGWAIFGVGAALLAVGLATLADTFAPCDRGDYDGDCEKTPFPVGPALGSIGAVSMIIGGIIVGASRHEAEDVR